MKRYLTLALAFICLASCQKAPELYLSSPATLELSADGGSGSITFTANRDWTATCSESWIHVSPSSGSAADGQITVSIRCDANTTYDDRSGTVTIKAEDLTQTIAVKQPANLGIIVPTKSYDITSSANTIEVEVQANVQYSVSISESWIKQAGTKGLTTNKISFSISENTSYYEREANIIIKQLNGNLIQTVKVYQSAKDGVKVVDLGLSVKWASANIGAKEPEEAGYYFAWGETAPKEIYSWWNYKWCDDSMKLTKYNTRPQLGLVDNILVLELDDDAARANWGGNWRTPTRAEWDELCAYRNCSWTWIDKDGVKGCEVVSKINGNRLFLPATNRMIGAEIYPVPTLYWSANIRTENDLIDSWVCTFSSDDHHHCGGIESRFNGLPIRAVTE